ncbi:asparagine synthase (glutamine-hydrolyzing) [Halomonas sp. 18H]|nr:asparagine synthase (glutamine-hydrolyzing) [Halomonas sp. 18H]MCW4152615.1 asparagine synthase (glutamine-hydrolyzing) [Halomonas sp. 18H]
MCGISGYLRFNDSAAIPDLKAISKQMRNRGPDCEGYFIESKNINGEFFSGDWSSPKIKAKLPPLPSQKVAPDIALIHRRLAIIDTSDASHQPMLSDCERYVICFNGEIYNYRELRKDLEDKGVSFVTTGDTEVLLKLYSRMKEKSLDLLNGDFAFSVWDKVEKKLFVARDRVGIKPVFFTKSKDFFIFASDIKTIIASGIYNPEVNLSGLYDSFFFGITPRPGTAFKNIFSLEAGTWMMIDMNGDVECERYWDIPHGEKLLDITYSEAVEVLKSKISDAVNLRMRADVEVGSFMSGGVDSTTITGFAAKNNPNIKAFTLGHPNESTLDEVNQAKIAAKSFGIEHVVEYVSPDYYLENIVKITEGYEEPFYSVSPNYIISEIVKRNGVKVVLNGLGGDELFGGYKYYQDYWIWDKFRYLGGFLRLLTPFLPSKIDKKASVLKAKNTSQYHTACFSKHRESEVEKLFGFNNKSSNSILDRVDGLYAVGKKFRSGFDALMYMDLKNYVGNHHVERTDQFTMMNSIEGRFPLLDHNLIEYASILPDEFKVKDGVGKRILKDAAKDLVPADCLHMKKKGFSFPLEKWMRNEFKNSIEEHLAGLKNRNVFVSSIIDQWYKDFLAHQRSHIDIWHLVSTEMWFRLFIDKDFLKGSSDKFISH